MTDLDCVVCPHSRLKGSRLSGNSRVHALFSLPDDQVILRVIEPQKAQRITESCYLYLSSALRHSVSSVVFQETLFQNIKSPGVLVTATRGINDPGAVASGDNYNLMSTKLVEVTHG